MYVDWHSNGAKRVLTSIAIVAGLVAAFSLRLLTIWVFDVIIMVLAFVAVWEVMRARRSEAKGVASYYVYSYMVMVYLTFLMGVLMNFALWLHVLMQGIVLGIFTLYTYLMNYMDKDFIKESELKKKKVGRSALSPLKEFLKIVICPFAMLFSLVVINHMGTWATIVRIEGAEPVGVPMVATFALLLVFVISCFTDTFAYLAGRALKGPKMLPKKLQHISPNKTLAGGIGGLFGGVVGALLVVLLCSMNKDLQVFLTDRIGSSMAVQFLFVAVGFVGAIVTTIGDLYASWLKRKAGIKDFGKFLPGHGGAMDRLDGISFNALFIWFVMMLVVFA